MPKYNVIITTELLNEEQLRILDQELMLVESNLNRPNRPPILNRIVLAEQVVPKLLEQHIIERVR